MKSALSLLVACVLLGLSLQAQSAPREAVRDAHRAAVESYVNAARIQLDAYRAEIAARVKAAPAEESAFAPALARLKRGDELLLRLKSATAAEFDPLKAEFERNRTALDIAVRDEPKR